MRQFSTATALVLLMAGPAFADGVNYARFSYDFTRYDNDDIDFELDSNLFQGGVEYTIGQVLLSADIANQDFEFGDELESSSLAYALSAGYFLTSQMVIGGGLIGTSTELELTGFGTAEDDTTGFEVFGQYIDQQVSVAVNVRNFDTDEDNVTSSFYGEFLATPEVALGGIVETQSEVDETTFLVSVDYESGPVDLRAYYTDSSEDSLGIFGTRGDYYFTNQIRGSAGLEVFTGSDLPEFYSFVFGAGYQIVDGLWADAKYGLLDGDDVEGDPQSVQFALTYEFGDRVRVDRRLEQDRIDDLQISAVPTLGF